MESFCLFVLLLFGFVFLMHYWQRGHQQFTPASSFYFFVCMLRFVVLQQRSLL